MIQKSLPWVGDILSYEVLQVTFFPCVSMHIWGFFLCVLYIWRFADFEFGDVCLHSIHLQTVHGTR